MSTFPGLAPPLPAVAPTLPHHVNLAKLAREIAMEIMPIEGVLLLHQIDGATWDRIRTDPRFIEQLQSMMVEWQSAANTKARIRVKAQTAIEAMMEPIIEAILDTSAPLNHRVEAMRQLARLGELEGQREIGGGGSGSGVNIQINIGGNEPPTVVEAITLPSNEDEQS